MAKALTVRNVCKTFEGGKKPVLNGLSFAAEAGEFIVLVGPSGCGKSTMLRAIAGLEMIDSGAIIIGDRDVTKLVPKDRQIAMVFQDYALYPHKSVYENIAFGLRIRRLPESEIDRRVKEAASKLNLTSFLNRKPGALSGGQRQRVAIGRAIVRDPDVFLFDEPLSNLDAKLRGSMRVAIGKLHRELNATIVYVTHDQVEAMTLADRIIVLDSGRIQQMGTPLELYYHPCNKFVAQFIGSPPMNMIKGRLTGEGDALGFESELGLRIAFPASHREKLNARARAGLEVYWGLRAENFILGSPESDPSRVFDLQVDVAEPLGPHTNVVGTLAGHDMQISIDEPHRPRAGQTLQVEWRSKHLYLFDATTGETLDRKLSP